MHVPFSVCSLICPLSRKNVEFVNFNGRVCWFYYLLLSVLHGDPVHVCECVGYTTCTISAHLPVFLIWFYSECSSTDHGHQHNTMLCSAVQLWLLPFLPWKHQNWLMKETVMENNKRFFSSQDQKPCRTIILPGAILKMMKICCIWCRCQRLPVVQN